MFPGPILLLGSGETAPSGQRAFDRLLQLLPASPQISLLETPAGFELNSYQVIGRVADFLQLRLQNYHPQVSIIRARKRGTPDSPDSAETAQPLLQSNLIFMGPGSPSYAIRQLGGSLVWQTLLARHMLGGGLAFASAGVVAVSRKAIPVYEIYKVGQDIHWIDGLDLFGTLGLNLVLVPHWNNQDGGEELDTSRCFMGRERFDPMLEMLSGEETIVGIDENTSLLIDFSSECCRVVGQSGVTIQRAGQEVRYEGEVSFSLSELGNLQIPDPLDVIPEVIWEQVLGAQRQAERDDTPPPEVLDLLDRRQQARQDKNWAVSDALRDQIQELGWQVEDTPQGPRLVQRA